LYRFQEFWRNLTVLKRKGGQICQILCRELLVNATSKRMDQEEVKLPVHPVRTGQARRGHLGDLPVNSAGIPREEAPFGRAEAEVV